MTRKHTYIYRINFQCQTESIVEADKLFMEQAQLFYGPKHLKGWMCPLITVEVVRDPQLRQQDESNAVSDQVHD